MSTDPNRLEHSRLEHFVERRAAQRFQVHQPLSVHFDGRTVPGFIQDLSGRGIFFYAETALPEGAVVELTFTMPSEITLGDNMPVRCRGRVLRASASSAGHFQAGHSQANQSQASHSQASQQNGIAVQLESYQYLPNEPLTQFVRVSVSTPVGATSGPVAR